MAAALAVEHIHRHPLATPFVLRVHAMSRWPELNHARDGETFAILHLASQMLGKLRVAYAPWVNHGWHATLHPVAEGLAIEPIASAAGNFTLTLDLPATPSSFDSATASATCCRSTSAASPRSTAR